MADLPQFPSSRPWRALEHFLLHRQLPASAAQTVGAAGLGSYAYASLDASHPVRAQFRADYTAALYQHLTTRAALRPLLHAWHTAGIRVLLFKGFHLSEFVYASPGQRPYSDVDILMRPEDAQRAAEVAQQMGWQSTWRLEACLVPHHHELLHLQSSEGQVSLDIHRRILHGLLPANGLQERITKAVWEAAICCDWEGVPLLLPDPHDAVLVGLVLQRAWGDDSWFLKPHDWPDFRALIDHHGINLIGLRHRAQELGCARTLDVFLGVCNPYRHHLNLRPRTRSEYLWRSLRGLAERPLLPFEHILFGWWNAWHKSRDVVRELPHVLRVLKQLRRTDNLHVLVRSVMEERRGPRSDPGDHPPGEREVQHVLRGVQLALALLRVRPEGNCLERALAVCASLQARGHSPVFCSGIRRDGAVLRSHAWVELGGCPLPDPWQPQDADLYRRNFAFPSMAGVSAVHAGVDHDVM